MTCSLNARWNGPAGRGGKRREWRQAAAGAGLALLLLFPVGDASGQAATARGLMKLSGEYAFDRDSVKDEPELTGRLILDGRASDWQVNAWLAGNWSIDPDGQHAVAVKGYDRVWGNGPRPLEIKELFAAHRAAGIDWRAGVQRFAWGRLDEFPINDLFNPWDYERFIVVPMEERKIGVPAVSAEVGRTEWTAQLVWVPWHVPYRLPDPDSRWSVTGAGSAAAQPEEPDLPAKTLGNGAWGLRVQRYGEIDGAVNVFHGFDPRPVFATAPVSGDNAAGDPATFAVTPAFHRITSAGLDSAVVLGPISLRGEAAWTWNRVFNLHGDAPSAASPIGENPDPSLTERARHTVDYGLAADFRPFEDTQLTVQAQQTAILSPSAALSDQNLETLIWADFRDFWWNQKLETGCNAAYNPEHTAGMIRATATYVLSDSWKTSLTLYLFDGPPESVFGRYEMNDQLRLDLVYQW